MKTKKIKNNLNTLAQEVAYLEGGSTNLSIAQVKEVLKSVGIVLASMKTEDAMAIVARLISRCRKI